MMTEVFKEPEIQKEMADALKSKDYRAHLQNVISETMESPLFKAKIQDIFLKAASEMKQKASRPRWRITHPEGDQGHLVLKKPARSQPEAEINGQI